MVTQNAGQADPSSIDPSEVAKFEAMAAEWWDPKGKFRPLHEMNPTRLDYIAAQISAEFDRDLSTRAPFDGLNLVDVGCGGGLLSEPMARRGAQVIGIDASGGTLPVARLHAAQSGLDIDYRHTSVEDLVRDEMRADVVLAMEVIEHVADPGTFLRQCAALLAPGGLLICSTLNKTAKSYALAIIGAERVMRWLPPGTHDWSKFISPDDLQQLQRDAGLVPVDAKGMVFDPLRWAWSLSAEDLSVNYVVTATKPG